MDFNQTLVDFRGSSSRQPQEHYEKSDTFLDSVRQEREPELSDIYELWLFSTRAISTSSLQHEAEQKIIRGLQVRQF